MGVNFEDFAVFITNLQLQWEQVKERKISHIWKPWMPNCGRDPDEGLLSGTLTEVKARPVAAPDILFYQGIGRAAVLNGNKGSLYTYMNIYIIEQRKPNKTI